MKHRKNILRWVAILCAALAAAAPAAARAAGPVNVWKIDSGPIDPAHYFGETVANGRIGIVSSTVPFQTAKTVLGGSYEKLWPESVSSIAQGFNFLNLAVSIDGAAIDSPSQVSGFHQTLDMKHADLASFFNYQNKAAIRYTIRALRQFPQAAMMSVSIAARQPITITVANVIAVPSGSDAPSWSHETGLPWLNHVQRYTQQIQIRNSPRWVEPLASAFAVGPTGTLTTGAAAGFDFPSGGGCKPSVSAQNGQLSFTEKLRTGQSCQFALVGTIVTSAQVVDPLNAARRLAITAIAQGSRSLVREHDDRWARLWQGDIEIESANPGDAQQVAETERDIHSMMYHLYSFVRAGTDASIPPMGLSRSSDGYYGHIFWDADTWMFPSAVALDPDLGRSMVRYRVRRLGAARKNARLNGYQGALYPWESAGSGEEAITPLVPPFEIHINADVAIAAWQYYEVTGDRSWLRRRGYPLLAETANYWVSRVVRSGPDRYNINHVIAADEYADWVDNDAFTNGAAKVNLKDAIAAATLLNKQPNPEWALVEKNIPILKFPDGVTQEYAGYDGRQTKQADVALLTYPLGLITAPEEVRRNLDYYGPRVDKTHGPAMTFSVLAILANRLGDPARALSLFKQGYAPHKRPPFGVLSETASNNNPYFITGAGGELQTMLYGFGGLEITAQGLVQRPSRLPAQWKSLTLTGIGPERKIFVVRQTP